MKRSTRRILFFIGVLIFIAVSYVVILYAQGYQYSFENHRFIRTGAVDVKVNTQAHIFLDDQDYGSTSFLSDTASISKLVPGTYSLSVHKEGYSIWQKKITIEEGFVQHFPHVLILPVVGQDAENVKKEITAVLYPPTPTPTASPSPSKTPKPTATPKITPVKDPLPGSLVSPTATPLPSGPFYIDQGVLYVQKEDGPQSIAQNVTKAYLSEDHQKILWTVGNQVWVYWLSNTDYQPFHEKGDIAMITSFKSPVDAVQWFRDSDHVVVNLGTALRPDYKIIETDNRGGLNIISY